MVIAYRIPTVTFEKFNVTVTMDLKKYQSRVWTYRLKNKQRSRNIFNSRASANRWNVKIFPKFFQSICGNKFDYTRVPTTLFY